MKTYILCVVAILLCGTQTLQAQKALPVQLGSLFAKIKAPENCRESFKECTIDSDSNSGRLSVKDAGAAMKNLESTVGDDMKELASLSMTSASYSAPPATPSADEVAKMSQNATQMQNMTPEQAMQMARQMQYSAASLPVENGKLMDEIGQAQQANSQLNITIGQLITAVSNLGGEYKTKISKEEKIENCPEFKVKGADMALPKCDCVKASELDLYQRRVAVENEFLQNLNAILQKYLSGIKTQVAIVDKVEEDLKYGDAVSIPAIKTQVVVLQQSVIGGLIPILSMVDDAIKASGSEYANIANVNKGLLSETCK